MMAGLKILIIPLGILSLACSGKIERLDSCEEMSQVYSKKCHLSLARVVARALLNG